MSKIILLGAGFSHNWGAPLAAEFTDTLMSESGLDDRCKALIRDHRSGFKGGGFEAALAELQQERPPTASLDRMEEGVRNVFGRINRTFFRDEFEINFRSGPAMEPDDDLKRFLASFDAIFTLNQDILLERAYCAVAEPPQAFNHRWSGYALPGMVQRVLPPALYPAHRWCGQWCPVPGGAAAPPDTHTQPIYKLHGSANWVAEDGGPLLIMGGDKVDAIKGSGVLRAYAAEFERRLMEPGTRLMVIGYGFGDAHINRALDTAAAAGGLEIFLIDPLGYDAPDPNRNAKIRLPPPVNPTQGAVVGVSKRPLSSTFGGDVYERGRVWDFILDR